MLTYGPSGRSRGIATIIFNRPGSAAEAAKQLNGVKVDNRAMKVIHREHEMLIYLLTCAIQIEVVLGAKSVAPVPAKTLGDRIS